MVAAIIHRKFEKDLRKIPPAIREWALGFAEWIESQDAARIKARASKIRVAGDFWAVKKRRRPDGDYRLVFEFVGEETVALLGCGSRQDAYQKILRRRGRA